MSDSAGDPVVDAEILYAPSTLLDVPTSEALNSSLIPVYAFDVLASKVRLVSVLYPVKTYLPA